MSHPATGLPSRPAPSSHRRGQRQPILPSQACQTDRDCPERWPLRCGAWDPRQARPAVAAAQGLSSGREQQAGRQAAVGGGRVAGSKQKPGGVGGRCSRGWKPGEKGRGAEEGGCLGKELGELPPGPPPSQSCPDRNTLIPLFSLLPSQPPRRLCGPGHGLPRSGPRGSSGGPHSHPGLRRG